ncbi:hypothetical protein LCGC14_1545530 [marine sediment metagenome]|uniref:Uncharacterized protein n=1 Tax=marine sediment metagenome TaxID=412755 RepID=A0A0F9IRP1_9ZZZZ
MKLELYTPDYYREIIRSCGSCQHRNSFEITKLQKDKYPKKYESICRIKLDLIANHVSGCKDYKGPHYGKKL